jgi:transcriptional regulator with XRE-family HTH domain
VITQEQRRELAEFIRSRRERRRPEDAGLPAGGGRRRTPGLRREEVATLAGLSITWYTWLEQARDIKVSRQVLGSLAPALGLDTVERAHLFRLAGEVPPADVTAGPEVSAPYRRLLAHLDPNPAFVLNRRCDVLACNRGWELFHGRLDAMPPETRNVLWLTFNSPAVRAMEQDWEQTAAHTLALFRALTGEHVLDPDIASLVGELECSSADFARLWRRRELTPFVPASHVLVHPRLGPVEFDYVKMHVTNDDKTVVAYLVAPGSPEEERLRELVAE